jgi:hypothetical protein
MTIHDIFEHAKWEVRKFRGDSTNEKDLYEVIEGQGNILTYGGASALWEKLVGGPATLNAFTGGGNARIGVGDSSTPGAASQQDLQGANKPRKVATVTRTDGTADGADDCVFQTTFSTAEANFAWNEWGIFNGDTGVGTAGGRMLNRRAEALGTKTSSATWQLTITLSLGGGTP